MDSLSLTGYYEEHYRYFTDVLQHSHKDIKKDCGFLCGPHLLSHLDEVLAYIRTIYPDEKTWTYLSRDYIDYIGASCINNYAEFDIPPFSDYCMNGLNYISGYENGALRYLLSRCYSIPEKIDKFIYFYKNSEYSKYTVVILEYLRLLGQYSLKYKWYYRRLSWYWNKVEKTLAKEAKTALKKENKYYRIKERLNR